LGLSCAKHVTGAGDRHPEKTPGQQETTNVVIPAEAGIHFALDEETQISMDSRFRGNDGLDDGNSIRNRSDSRYPIPDSRYAGIDVTPRSAYNYALFSHPFPTRYCNRSYTLANIKSAKKRARQAVKRNARNSSARSMLRTAIKKVVNAIAAKDKTAAEAAYKSAEPVMDRYASRGLIHKNKASRHKSRLTGHIKALA
jgi:small subunit ribosomal protein S20